MIITMDQVNVQDFDYTAGYGGFRYGIVICSLKTDYWIFVPLRTLGCSDAHAAFVQFRIVHKLKSPDIVVYCDVHQSLRQICYLDGVPVEHPPPGRSEANASVEKDRVDACVSSIFFGTGRIPHMLVAIYHTFERD